MATTVSTFTQLQAALAAANAAVADTGAIEIDVSGTIVQTADFGFLNLASGNSLTIRGAGPEAMIDGQGQYVGLVVTGNNETLALNDITFANNVAENLVLGKNDNLTLSNATLSQAQSSYKSNISAGSGDTITFSLDQTQVQDVLSGTDTPSILAPYIGGSNYAIVVSNASIASGPANFDPNFTQGPGFYSQLNVPFTDAALGASFDVTDAILNLSGSNPQTPLFGGAIHLGEVSALTADDASGKVDLTQPIVLDQTGEALLGNFTYAANFNPVSGSLLAGAAYLDLQGAITDGVDQNGNPIDKSNAFLDINSNVVLGSSKNTFSEYVQIENSTELTVSSNSSAGQTGVRFSQQPYSLSASNSELLNLSYFPTNGDYTIPVYNFGSGDFISLPTAYMYSGKPTLTVNGSQITISGEAGTTPGSEKLVTYTLDDVENSDLGGGEGAYQAAPLAVMTTGGPFAEWVVYVPQVGGSFTTTSGQTTAQGAPIIDGTNAPSNVVASGGGTLVLDQANSYTGGTEVQTGNTLSIANDGNLGTGGVLTLDVGSTLAITGTGSHITHAITISGDPTVNVASGTTAYQDAPISDGTAPGDLVVTGGGTYVLTAANTYTGSTTVSDGTLALAEAADMSSAGSIADSSEVALATAGTFDISGLTAGTSITTLADSASGQTGHVALGAETLTITAGLANFSGVIADGGISGGSGGSLVVVSGTQRLAGANTYTGGTTIAGGTLDLAAAGSAGTGAITFATPTGSATETLALEVVSQPADGSTFGNTLANFNAAGETLELVGFTANSSTYTVAAGVLSVDQIATSADPTEKFALSNGTKQYTATTDSYGDTFLTPVTATPMPTVVSSTETATPTMIDVGIGKTVTFTLQTSAAVNATGSTLTLADGSTPITATAAYVSGDGTATSPLEYGYTVASGDTAVTDLQATGFGGVTPTSTDGSKTPLDTTGFAPIDSMDMVDAMAPAAPMLALKNDTGSSSTDKLTKDPTITYTPSASGDTLLYAADGSTYTTTQPTFATNGTQDGGHTVSVEEQDAAGNVSSATSLTFTLDTTPPTVSLNGNPTNQQLKAGSNLLFDFKVSDVNLVPPPSSFMLSNGGIARDYNSYGSYPNDEELYSYTVAQTDTNTSDLTVTLPASFLTDGAGNVASLGTIDLMDVVDTVPPAVTEMLATDTGVSQSDGITSSVTLTGGGDPGATVTFSENGATLGTATGSGAAVGTAPAGTYTYTPTGLAQGQHTVVASETDAAGNTGTASLTFTYDTTPPTIASYNAASPANATVKETGTVDISFNTSEAVNVAAGSTLTLNNGAVASYDAAKSTTTDLDYTYTVASGDANTTDLKATALTGTITDIAGNTLADSGFTAIDTKDAINTIPSAPSQDGTAVNGGPIMVKGTVAAGDTVMIYNGASLVGQASADATTGVYDFATTTTFKDGIYHLTATETTAGSAASGTSAAGTFDVDPSAPSSIVENGHPINNAQLQFTVTGETGQTINLTVAGAAAASTQTETDNGAAGTYVVTTNANYADSKYTVSATQTDGSQLTSAPSSTINATVYPGTPIIDTAIPGADSPTMGTPLTVSGTGDKAADTITIYETASTAGAMPVAIGTIPNAVDGNGNFSVTTNPVGDGTYAVTAVETDAANVSSYASQPVTATVPPSAPSGLMPDGTSIAGNGVTIKGVGDAGDSVALYADGNTTAVVGTGTVGAGGTFDITTSATYTEGKHSFTATETSPDGTLTSGQSTATTASVAPLAPTGLAQKGTATYNQAGRTGAAVEITGTGDLAGDTINLYANGGTTAVGTGTVAADGSFDITTTTLFADGTESITATDTSKDGVTSASSGHASSPVLTDLVSFNGTDGKAPSGGLVEDTSGNLYGTTSSGSSGAYGGYGVVFEIDKAAGTATGYAASPTLLSSLGDTTAGIQPLTGLYRDAAGDLIGTSAAGGAMGSGSLFELTPADSASGYGPATLLAAFNSSNGSSPSGGTIVADAAGDLFGTTISGGRSNVGSVYELAKTATGYASAIKPLVTFNGTNGSSPSGGLFIDAAGNLFGTTFSGGSFGSGTVFEIVNGGSAIAPNYSAGATTLVSINSAGTGDGGLYGNLVEDAAGNLFGTTFAGGGSGGAGTIFEIARSATTATGYASTQTTLATFMGPNGAMPEGALAIDSSGNLYGTTAYGGMGYTGSGTGDGTVFELAKSATSATGYAATVTELAAFNGADGAIPYAGVTLDGSDHLFGTTSAGGASSDGVAFEIAPPATGATAVIGAPAPSGLTQAGMPSNGGSIEIKGVGDATGDTITVYGATSGGAAAQIGTTTVTSNGSFDYVSTQPFADGTYTITATDTSVDMMVTSGMSAAATAMVGATAPTNLTVAPASNGGTLTVTGTGDAAGDTVTVYALASNASAGTGPTAIGTAVVQANDSFTVTSVQSFADGDYSITAVNTSADTTQTSMSSTPVTAHVAAPVPIGLMQAGMPVNGQTIEVTGNGDAVGDTINLTITNNQTNAVTYGTSMVVAATVVGQPDTFDFKSSALYADGTYSVTATDTSVDGKQTSVASTAATVTVLPTAPTGLVEANHPGNGGKIEVKGTAEPGDTVILYEGTTAISSAVVANMTTGAFDIAETTTQPVGTYPITATATDSANLVSAASSPLTAYIYPARPAIASATVGADVPAIGTTVELKGTGYKVGDTITVYATQGSTKAAVGTGSVMNDGTYDVTTSALHDGTYTLTTTDTEAGATSTASQPLTVKLPASAPTGLAQSGTVTYGSPLSITGNGDIGDTVTISAATNGGAAAVIGTTTVMTGGTFVFASSGALADGTYEITATDMSADGTQVSVASTSIEAAVGANAPTGLAQTNMPVTGGVISISGQTSDAATDTVAITATGPTSGAAPIFLGDATVTAGANGGANSFALTSTQTFVNGQYTITATDISVDGTQRASATTTATVAGAAPTIANTSTAQTTTAEAPVTPFGGASVRDPNAAAGSGTGGTATDTLTITLSGGNGGTLSEGAGFTGTTTLMPAMASNNYTLTGTGAAITAELDELSFTPTAGGPDTSSTTTFTLSDTTAATSIASNTDATSVVTDTDAPVAPTIGGVATTTQTTASEATVMPFSTGMVSDANKGGTNSDTLTITQTGAGTLSGAGLVPGAAGTYTLTGTAASITSQLDGLVFTPVDGVPNTTVSTSFTLQDADATAGTSSAKSAPVTVTDTDPAVAPTITGAEVGQTTTSEMPDHPFSTVTVGDANAKATETLTIALSGGGGTLSGAGTATDGVYTLTGSAASVTTQLAAVSFTPTAGAPNTSATTTFTLSDTSSAFATATTDATTTVTDTDPAVAPTITGAKDGQTTTSEMPDHPFSMVTVGDANANAAETLTIALSGGGGTLSGAGTATNGIYTLTGSAASVTSQLAAVSFTPTAGAPNTSTTTTFTLSDTSSAFATATTDATTTVIDTDPASPVTITSPAFGSTTNLIDPTIAGTAQAGSTITLTSGQTTLGTAAVDGNGNWSDHVTFATDGSYTVTATDTSVGVVAGPATDTFSIDSTPNEPLFGTITTNVNSVGGEVYALYETIFGRAPDPIGFEGWVAAVASGTPLTTVAQGMLGSAEYSSDYGSSTSSNSGFVNQLYEDGLHRSATADPGSQGWVDALANGSLTRAQVAVDIATSHESQNDLAPTFQQGVFVPDASDSATARLYYGLFDRAPDAGGLQGWEGAVHSGTPLQTVATDLLQSPEYQSSAPEQSLTQYVTGLYQTALDRAPSASDLSAWVGSFENGTNGVAGIADGILDSNEFQSDEAGQSNAGYVNAVYQAALGRPADAAGLQGWQNALDSHSLSRIQVAQDIVGSQEFATNVAGPQEATFVNAIYEGIYGRPAAASEVQSAQTAFIGGVTPASIALGIIESPAAAAQLVPKIEAGFHLA